MNKQRESMSLKDELLAAAEKYALHENGLVDPAKFYAYCAGWQACLEHSPSVKELGDLLRAVNLQMIMQRQGGAPNLGFKDLHPDITAALVAFDAELKKMREG